MPGLGVPFVIAADEGRTIRGPVGGPMTFKANAETTNGTFTALENIVPPDACVTTPS